MWGDPFRGPRGGSFLGAPPPKPEYKELPMPGQKQAAAANRLAKGFSSRRHSSAPSAIGAPSAADAGLECSDRLASAVAYAKQWRRRVEDTRQHTGHVALVPKTFAFG